ncbi:MAG TPA: FHA domain-containing protein [Aggregatilineales bacterium]|nr:FHA domain-containing protein [Anaerolineales bacterium]HRE48626.1 FHA domain-containing protein [Aggregatilineales bacterium]
MTDATNPTTFKCVNCGAPFLMGELVCGNCGAPLVTGGRTHKMEEVAPPKSDRLAGDAGAGQKPIYLEISGEVIQLPPGEEVVIGRRHGTDTLQPTVDLSSFRAEEYGVSRLHVRIKRKGDLIYVIDLNSTNGTFLNGRKLIPNGERVLRDKDDLSLGKLRTRVRF